MVATSPSLALANADPRPSAAPSAGPARAERNEAIDCLRGIVMILMALDHTRDFVGPSINGLSTVGPALFFTRWITHYCAPVFVLLAGTAAWLHGRRLSTAELSRWLATRGLWLVFLEVTVVRAAWMFYLGSMFGVFQVIWAIGASMVVLAMLVWLPRPVLAAGAVAVIATHNLLDGVRADDLGTLRWLWLLLHQPGSVAPFEGSRWFVAYPLIPWFAVMAAGYALGPWVALPRVERRRRVALLGGALTVGFVVLRATISYGDPYPWDPARGLLGFLDCQKYPPSLLYLAMTLGPALLVLAALDHPLGAWERRVQVFGRVPLFYYVLHIFLIHAIAIALAWPSVGSAALTRQFMDSGGLGLSLPAVYATWIAVVVLLYAPSAWFAGVKRRSSARWLSYL